jgi:hypothetical protein
MIMFLLSMWIVCPSQLVTSNPAITGDRAPMQDSNIIGEAAMDPDGTLRITLYPPVRPELSQLVFVPGSPDYEYMRHQAGQLRPGQRSPFYRQVGSVRMNSDRTLSISLIAAPPGWTTLRAEETLRPQDEEYGRILARTGPMEPGDVRPLLAGH